MSTAEVRVRRANDRGHCNSDAYIELAKHVTGRQGHFAEIGWIPGRHNDATVFRVVLDLVNALGELINTLTCVVGVHVNVLSPKVTPLKAIDRSQIPGFSIIQAPRVQKLT